MSNLDLLREEKIRKNRTKIAFGSLALLVTLAAAGYGIYLLIQNQNENQNQNQPPNGGNNSESESTKAFVGIAVVAAAVLFQIVIFYFRKKIFATPLARIRTNENVIKNGEPKGLTEQQAQSVNNATVRKLTDTKPPKSRRASSVISTGSFGEWQRTKVGGEVKVLGMTHATPKLRNELSLKKGDDAQGLQAVGRLRSDTAQTIDSEYAIQGLPGYSLSEQIFDPVNKNTAEIVTQQLRLFSKMMKIVDEYLENVIVKGERNVPQIQFLIENDGSHIERATGAVPGKETNEEKLKEPDENPLLPLTQRIYVPTRETFENIGKLNLKSGSFTDAQANVYKNKIYPEMRFADHNFNTYKYSDQDKKNILTNVLLTIGAEPLIFTYFTQKLLEYKETKLSKEQKSRLENEVQTPLMKAAMGPNAFWLIEEYLNLEKFVNLLKDFFRLPENSKTVVKQAITSEAEVTDEEAQKFLKKISNDKYLSKTENRETIKEYIVEGKSLNEAEKILESNRAKMIKYSPRIASVFYKDLYEDSKLTDRERYLINNIARDIWAYETLLQNTKNQEKKQNVFVVGARHNFKDLMKKIGSKIKVEQDSFFEGWDKELSPEIRKRVKQKIKEYIQLERNRVKDEREAEKILDEAL
jgi:hypothetical protein